MNGPLPWRTHKQWAVERYGHPVFRVPVDPGWGCPNRAEDGGGGCTFCAFDGGRARQLGNAENVAQQVRKAADFARNRYGARHLQLYLQAYTATHASTRALRAFVEPLLEAEPFHSLSLGTRPDCLSSATLDLLAAWNPGLEVWVELGVQSTHDTTLGRIRRGHHHRRSEEAIRRLHDKGLRPCAHLIFGLPGESPDDMIESVERLARLPIHGIKLHNLHVLRGSPMGDQWMLRPFHVLRERAYLPLVAEALRRVPADIPVFRVFTDSPPELRLAPEPEMTKGQFINQLADFMRAQGWEQGQINAVAASPPRGGSPARGERALS